MKRPLVKWTNETGILNVNVPLRLDRGLDQPWRPSYTGSDFLLPPINYRENNDLIRECVLVESSDENSLVWAFSTLLKKKKEITLILIPGKVRVDGV